MSGTIRISMKAGEKLYVNGAVIRTDRKTTLELLNDVVFLLENHVMQEEDATTPLRKLYFSVQKILIDPANGFSARQEFYQLLLELMHRYDDDNTANVLSHIRALVNTGKNFAALKHIRTLYEAEETLSAMREVRDASAQTDGAQKVKGAAQ